MAVLKPAMPHTPFSPVIRLPQVQGTDNNL